MSNQAKKILNDFVAQQKKEAEQQQNLKRQRRRGVKLNLQLTGSTGPPLSHVIGIINQDL